MNERIELSIGDPLEIKARSYSEVVWSSTGGSIEDLGYQSYVHTVRFTADSTGKYMITATEAPGFSTKSLDISVVLP